jgi:predicted nuclease of restriction endonuclease-like (RecB) superfamily
MSNKDLQKTDLLGQIKALIMQSQQQLAVSVNSALTLLYWQIGKRINEEILSDKRADYGKQIIKDLAVKLTEEYGKGWGEKQLRQCIKFSQSFPEKEIVYTLCIQLSWSHIRLVMFMDEPIKRDFYIEMCKLEKWSVRTFQERINSLLYERTAISKKPEQTIIYELDLLKSAQLISPDLVFRDPYFLDFLGLKDAYSEKDMEASILADLQKFIIELGSDFTFMARQKRITIDEDDYYMDLLFFHRRLRCLVVIELKLGKFDATHKGQMELYLRWLEKHETIEGENPPIGLILCAYQNREHIELLQLHKSNIKVAQYLTQLPDMKLLENKLHQAIENAKNRVKEKET